MARVQLIRSATREDAETYNYDYLHKRNLWITFITHFLGGLYPKHLGAIVRDQFQGEMIINIRKD
jgi:hypothetical protein